MNFLIHYGIFLVSSITEAQWSQKINKNKVMTHLWKFLMLLFFAVEIGERNRGTLSKPHRTTRLRLPLRLQQPVSDVITEFDSSNSISFAKSAQIRWR
jgi:hypothetical protein